MAYSVYILTNYKRTVLYIGLTRDLTRRIEQHKKNKIEGFSRQYNVHMPIYYELYDDIYEAKARERALKKWYRVWKEELIARSNPDWEEILII
jgi:putative endonuclease